MNKLKNAAKAMCFLICLAISFMLYTLPYVQAILNISILTVMKPVIA